jgi:hypothetical protein
MRAERLIQFVCIVFLLVLLNVVVAKAHGNDACRMKVPANCDEVRVLVKCYGKTTVTIAAKVAGITSEQMREASACLRDKKKQ